MSVKKVRLFVFSALIFGCIDPATPEYDLISDLVYVEGFVSTEAGISHVVISESIIFSSGTGSNVLIDDADVFFVNTVTDEQVTLNFKDEFYLPPANFAASVGETWMLEVILPNGKRYVSSPEIVLEPVPIKSIEAHYNPELAHSEVENSYIPGHVLSVSFEDPQNVQNHYYWNFRSYEKISKCERCTQGIFRNGNCEDQSSPNMEIYYDYLCDSDCWQIRRAENIKIYFDEFSDGLSVANVPVADIFYYKRKNILVELQQFTISASAYHYYRIIQDIVQNNSNLNAPPPAALIGNIHNPDDSEEYVLGRFTTAASASEHIFINRMDISERPIEWFESPIIYEGCEVCVDVECRTDACPLLYVPCEERRDRTAIMPQGWIE